jgi:hypothetical protein
VPVLILEDNLNKVQQILREAEDVLRAKVVLICGYVGEAWIDSQPPGVVVDAFVDYELHPGAGNGVNFLEECVPSRIGTVYLTSMNPGMRKEMHKLAVAKGIRRVVSGW